MNEDELITLLAEWMADAYKAIDQAGGLPGPVLSSIPPAVIGSLARNRLRLVYVPPK